jgi:20S proteasome alpha/beta subunit
MLSSGSAVQATDNATLKSRKIAKRWALMFAADDANLFLPIVKSCWGFMEARGEDHDLHTVQDAVVTAYSSMFDAEFTSRYLARYSISSITAFRGIGLAQFGQERFDRVCDEIDRFDLGITLLCYGYDTKKIPHIFEVSNPGKITEHDLLGYAVIGSGWYMATASLRRRTLPPDLEMMIYRLLEAKFSAETALGVGKSTSLLTMNSDGKDGAIGSGSIEKIREVWERTLKEPEPQDAIDIISKTEAVRRIVDGER